MKTELPGRQREFQHQKGHFLGSQRTRNHEERGEARTQQKHGRTSSGINYFMRAYQNRKQFASEWDQDINSALLMFNTLERICHVTQAEKREEIPLMLRDEAFDT